MNEDIQKYLAGELSAEEKLNLLKRIEADEALKTEFIDSKNAFALLALATHPNDEQENKLARRRLQNILRKQNIKHFFLHKLSYAAALIVAVLSTFLFTKEYMKSTFDEAAMTTLFVPAGQRMQVCLSDGTKVWLNAHTTLRYPTNFYGNQRKVEVEGEALFEVAKDKTKPFIVSARHAEIEVLGTTFNVYNYASEKEMRTSLLEGSLRIKLPKVGDKTLLLKPNEEARIIDSEMNKQTIGNREYFLWTQGLYSFKETRLGYILEKLAIYYDIQIEVRNPSIRNWVYTGKFRQSDGIDEILRMIQKFHNFTVKRDRELNKIIIN